MIASIICALLGSSGKETLCKSCARKTAVQTVCKQISTRNLCKLVQQFGPPWRVAGLWRVQSIVWRTRQRRAAESAPAVTFISRLCHGQAWRESIQHRAGRLYVGLLSEPYWVSQSVRFYSAPFGNCV